MLDKLLSIAQAESGTRRAPFTPQSRGEIGADVVELYEDLAEHEGVTLTWERTHPAPLLGDRSLLAGALVNVVDNAIKYGGRAPACACSRERAGRGRRRLQRNLGAGRWPRAPPEALATLGERFLRLRPELPGHGLGLASVRAVMQLHGGSMRLEPARPACAWCCACRSTHPEVSIGK